MFVFAGQFIGNEWFYNECRYQLTTILMSLIKTEATSSSSSHRIPEHALLKFPSLVRDKREKMREKMRKQNPVKNLVHEPQS